MKYFVTISFAILFCVGSLFAQWEYWEANELPTVSADTAWHFEQEADGQSITYSTIIDDPDITGNKLLQFSETEGTPKETFRNNWDADPTIGATLVLRIKPIDPSTYSRDWDIYLQNGLVRERFVSNNGAEVKFDKSKAAVQFDTKDWHIYRLAILEDQIELYIDEDPLSYILTTGESDSSDYFRFGDLGSNSIGTLYDWIAWDVSGAYPPGEGYAFPEVLTGLPTSVEKISEVVPEKFELMQNYPNPFNPETEIRFNIRKNSEITLSIFDIKGSLVQTLVHETKPAGEYSAKWNGMDSNGVQMPSGVYFYQLKAGNSVSTKKMTLLK